MTGHKSSVLLSTKYFVYKSINSTQLSQNDKFGTKCCVKIAATTLATTDVFLIKCDGTVTTGGNPECL